MKSGELGVQKTITAVVGAYGTSEWGDAPQYATFEVTRAFLDRVAKLAELCSANDLSEVRVAMWPDWGPGTIEEDLRLQNGLMVVRPDGSFWFTDYPKYGDYSIESRPQELAEVAALFEKGASGDIVFLCEEGDDLQEVYEQGEEQGAELPAE